MPMTLVSPEFMDMGNLNIKLPLPRDGEEPAFACVTKCMRDKNSNPAGQAHQNPEETAFVCVTKRMRDKNSNPAGQAHQNPILDICMFEVEFLDGTIQALSANVITENMFAQVDSKGQ